MAEWGNDGRILDSARAYSPFVRHKEKLDLGEYIHKAGAI